MRDRRTRVPWLVAIPVSSMDDVFGAPDCPSYFSVVAADGSSVPPDRHSPARFYVLNTGRAILTYGERPSAVLDASAQFHFQMEDLYLYPSEGSFPIEGARLSAKMAVAELRGLREATERTETPVAALRDGSLILWGLQNEDSRVQQRFLREFLECLDDFQNAGVPVVGYTSLPGARDVVNSLRVWFRQAEAIDCANCSSPEAMGSCKVLVTILDRQL